MILVSDSATPLPIVNQSRLFEGSGRTSLFYPIFSLLSTPSLFLRPFHAFFGYASPFSSFFFLFFCNFLPLFSCASLRLFKPIFCFLFLRALFISFLRLFCAFPAPFSACFRAFFSCFFPLPSPLHLLCAFLALLFFFFYYYVFFYIFCVFFRMLFYACLSLFFALFFVFFYFLRILIWVFSLHLFRLLYIYALVFLFSFIPPFRSCFLCAPFFSIRWSLMSLDTWTRVQHRSLSIISFLPAPGLSRMKCLPNLRRGDLWLGVRKLRGWI